MLNACLKFFSHSNIGFLENCNIPSIGNKIYETILYRYAITMHILLKQILNQLTILVIESGTHNTCIVLFNITKILFIFSNIRTVSPLQYDNV